MFGVRLSSAYISMRISIIYYLSWICLQAQVRAGLDPNCVAQKVTPSYNGLLADDNSDEERKDNIGVIFFRSIFLSVVMKDCYSN